MGYLKVSFKDNNNYYGDFIIKDDIAVIGSLLRCLTKSKGVIISDIFDILVIETIGSYIDRARDLDIVKQIQSNKNLYSKNIKLCIDCIDKNKVLKKLEELSVNCENIIIVNDIDELEDYENDDMENENRLEPMFLFRNSLRPIRNYCYMCNNYEYICLGETLCTHCEPITKKDLYLKMYLEKIKEELNDNTFILMRMFNYIEKMDESFAYLKNTLNEYEDEKEKEKLLKSINDDYEYASKLSEEEVESLIEKYDFNNIMYSNFQFKDSHNKELNDYYFNQLKNKYNALKTLKEEDVEKYIDSLKSLDYFINFSDEISILKDFLDEEYCSYYEQIKKYIDDEMNYYYDKIQF